jgi:20S proteasome alpha/beta subunit
MTLLVCLKSEGKLVLACDSRGTFGDPRGVTAQNDSQIKLFRLTSRVGIMVAGVGELGATVVQALRVQITEDEAGIDEIIPKVSASLASMFDRWFPDEKFQIVQMNAEAPARPDIACVLAGFPRRGSKNEQEGQIYSLVSQLNFAPLLHNYGFGLSGVAQYALYLMNRIYQSDITLENAISIAHYVITETATQDGKVGGPVRMAVISPDAGYSEIPSADSTKLKEKDRKVNEALAKLFRPPIA